MMIEKLDQNEILRYLGYQDSGVTESIQKLLDRCEKETLQVITQIGRASCRERV